MLDKKIHGVPIKEYLTDLVSKEVDVEPNNPAFRCFNDKFHVYVRFSTESRIPMLALITRVIEKAWVLQKVQYF